MTRVAILALIALAAFLGLRAGWRYATLTETDMIEAAAADYVATTGGSETDCLARPADGAWLEVACTPASGETLTYRATRLGRLTRVAP